MHKWKRGLLKIWLALSLLWALGFAVYLTYVLSDLLGGAQTSGLLIAFGLLYLLPFGALPPFVLLALGALIIWIIGRLRPTHDTHL